MIIKKISNLFGVFLKNWIDVKLGKLNSKEIFKQILLLCFILAVISTVSNIIMNLALALIYTTSIIAIFLGVLYYFCRFKKYHYKILYIFIVSLFFIVNSLWITNGGSFGPTLLIVQAFVPMFLFFSDVRKKLYIIFLFSTNVMILFAIEYFFPEWILGYNSRQERLIDIFIISAIFFIFEVPLLYYIQKQFIAESMNAINSEKVKSAFLANMSHEIRTPMNAIIGFTELLRENEINETTKNQYIDIIKDNGNVLLQLINNVMDASKIEAGVVEVNLKMTKIKPLFERIYSTFLNQIPSNKNLIFTFKIPEELKHISFYTDELLLYQIISNLITNAIKFTENGFIELGLEAVCLKNPEWIRIYVKDTGPGISEDSKTEIFKRFNQGKFDLRDKKEGIGLGLAISNELVNKINGKIDLYSDGKTGSTFYVKLYDMKPSSLDSL